ncbi:phosphodiester glycosidase family protein [Clostridium aciditolerans]|uniref:Phosphodiester glycosidase family protein n=1 Tax=Clostridium aciditolerans TaxID=339861 RepID=A0A934HSF1_9CLOT|nr:phosphodiester glycosidase family protein [Clostridium aciditolerans]MBI6872448.1 phosphodiester glycosidase family protein [Clostridium aciditolerans]
MIDVNKNRKSRKNKKNKRTFKCFLPFIIYEIIVVIITAPILVFYGPFKDVTNMVVNTAMKTFTHQYIATTFLSNEKINQIMKESKSGEISEGETENQDNVTIKHSNDKGIERYDIPDKRFDGYMLEVKDPARVKVGYTKKLGQVGQKTSEIAQDNGAIAAINGGGFVDKGTNGKLWVGTGAYPDGIVISGGESINKVNPSEKVSVAAFTSTGKLIVGMHSLDELLSQNVKEAISFDPPLIINGKTVSVDAVGLNPRTAIGQKEDGTVVLLVIDGRRVSKPGATLKEVQNILLQQGVVNATNLDGGSSSTMYLNGEVINNPCDWNGERTVATAIYIKP